jgi:hypothetical protein|tara:strand:- start:427 stop:543 length:117 start_codon:yes stop_codon:yes gene_type:complete
VVVGVRLTQTLLDQHQLLEDLVVEDHIQVMEVLEIHLL